MKRCALGITAILLSVAAIQAWAGGTADESAPAKPEATQTPRVVGHGGAGNPFEGNNLATATDPSWAACEKSDDCVVVQLSTCDACNGGKVVAVNSKSTNDAWEKMWLREPLTKKCTQRYCPGGFAADCDAGHCRVLRAAPALKPK